MWRLPACVVSIVTLCAAPLGLPSEVSGPVVAGTVDSSLGGGIGTKVLDAFGDGSNEMIDTSITTVRYESAQHITRNRLSYFEVLGTIEGIGWGGVHQEFGQGPPGPPVDAYSHYAYAVPFVLRWPADFDGTLVYYGHGFATLAEVAFIDSILGPDHEARHYEALGSAFVSDIVLDPDRRHGFFAANLGGIGRDGEFTAIALEGPYSGEPVVTSLDVPIVRDMVQVAARLLERFSERAVERVFGTGHSAGALAMQFINGSVSTGLFGPPIPILTGGNFVEAYDPASGRVFDGFLPLAGSDVRVHPQFPLTAPMILLGGTADYAAVDNVSYAGRLLNNGVDLNANVRIYHLANMPHVFAEITESVPNQVGLIEDLFGIHIGRESDRMVPVIAAALDNLRRWVVAGTPPPSSRIAGDPVDSDGDGATDEIRFLQVGGATTTLFPYVEDPMIDATLAPQVTLSAAAGLGSLVTRYARVVDEHARVPGAIQLPYQSCRLGGYELTSNARLLPFGDLETLWPGFGDYNSCLRDAVNGLNATGLYDGKLGKRVVVTHYIEDLFGR